MNLGDFRDWRLYGRRYEAEIKEWPSYPQIRYSGTGFEWWQERSVHFAWVKAGRVRPPEGPGLDAGGMHHTLPERPAWHFVP